MVFLYNNLTRLVGSQIERSYRWFRSFCPHGQAQALCPSCARRLNTPRPSSKFKKMREANGIQISMHDEIYCCVWLLGESKEAHIRSSNLFKNSMRKSQSNSMTYIIKDKDKVAPCKREICHFANSMGKHEVCAICCKYPSYHNKDEEHVKDQHAHCKIRVRLRQGLLS